MDEQVNQQVKQCQLCQSCNKTATPAAAPPQRISISAVGEVGYMDIVLPLEVAPYAITLTDYYSNWPELPFTATVTSDNVITFPISVLSRFGNPGNIVTDNVSQYSSAEFAEYFKSRDIQQMCTSVYHPAANGAIFQCSVSTVYFKAASFRTIALPPIQPQACLLLNYSSGERSALP